MYSIKIMNKEKNKQKSVSIASNAKKTLLQGYTPTLTQYAIIQTGGKQYFALNNATLAVEKIEGESGKEVIFSDVLLRRIDEKTCEIGTPFLKEPVQALIIKQTKDPKIIVFKFKRRKKYKRKLGHRQPKTVVRFTKVV